MDYKDYKTTLETMAKDNYEGYIKALISIEKGIDDDQVLDRIYDAYMERDTLELLSDDFDCLINKIGV